MRSQSGVARPYTRVVHLETRLFALTLLGCLLISLVPLTGAAALVWPVWLLAPGYLVLRTTTPRALSTWTRGVFLSLAVSPAVTGFLLLALTWCGLSLRATSMAVLATIGAALFAVAWVDHHAVSPDATAGNSWPVIVLLLLFVPLQAVTFVAPVHRLSVHGLFHGAYIGQVRRD